VNSPMQSDRDNPAIRTTRLLHAFAGNMLGGGY